MKRKQSDITGSTVILGGTGRMNIYHEYGMDRVQSARVCRRQTEIAAQERMTPLVLTELHHEMMYLERVCCQPDLYPEVKNRPLRRIGGVALHDWIGKRLNMSRKDVQMEFKNIEAILNQNARAFAW